VRQNSTRQNVTRKKVSIREVHFHKVLNLFWDCSFQRSFLIFLYLQEKMSQDRKVIEYEAVKYCKEVNF